jgi:hypothetical protein
VDQSIAKVQAPLDTAVKFSHSLDKVHDKTAETLTRVADAASENISSLTENVNSIKEKVQAKTGSLGSGDSDSAPADEAKAEG